MHYTFLLLNLCYFTSASSLTPWMTPVNIHFRSDGIFVDLCEVNWEKYKGNPTAAPLGADIQRLSDCRGSAMALNVPFSVLEAEYEERGCAAGGLLMCEPAGLIQHEARVGSTLAANMLAVLPNTLVYSESEIPYQVSGDAFKNQSLKPDHVIRVIFAAFARPIAASAAGIPSARFAEFSRTFKPDP